MPEPRSFTSIAGAARAAGKRAVVGGASLVGEVRRRLGERRAPETEGGTGPVPTGRPSSRPRQEPPEPRAEAEPERAPDGVAASGFPEPPGKDPGDISKDPSPYSALSNPVVDDPDLTAETDPYEQRDGSSRPD